jgi:hypothetical protein
MSFLNEEGLRRLWGRITTKLDTKVNIDDLPELIKQPDFAASEGEAGHIKNRTHWVDYIENGGVASSYPVNDQGLCTNVGVELYAGRTYKITIAHGESYICETKQVDNSAHNVYCGNKALHFSDADDTGEPFYFSWDALDAMGTMRVPQYANTTIDIAVIELIPRVHQLDSKFIKDMYYVESITAGDLIVPECELVNNDGTFTLPSTPSELPKLGETYFITYNGVQYECTAQQRQIEDILVTVLGNSTFFGSENTGEPFVILTGPAVAAELGISFVLMPIDSAQSVTLSIAKAKENIKHINPKYIKDMYYTEGGEEKLLFEVNPLTNNNSDPEPGWYLPYTNAIDLGEATQLAVTWDGVIYNCPITTLNEDDAVLAVVGNMALLDASAPDTGEPFGVMLILGEAGASIGISGVVGWAADGNQQHSISVSTIAGKIHKIDNKYIDAEWMATSNILKGAAFIENVTFPLTDGAFEGTGTLDAVAGDTFVIVYNDTEYTCKLQDISALEGIPGAIATGNLDLAMGVGDNGMPFVMVYVPSADGNVVAIIDMYNPEATSCTVSIYKAAEVVNKLPNKFIDAEWMATSKIVKGKVVLDESEYNCDSRTVGTEYCATIPDIALVSGQEYIVKFDDAEYTVKCVYIPIPNEDNTGIFYMGNMSMLSSDGADSGEPFAIYSAILNGNFADQLLISYEGVHNVAVYELTEKPNKLPNKFINAAWMATYDSIIEIFPEVSLAGNEGLFSGYAEHFGFTGETKLPRPFEIGKTYVITYNGTPYTCTAVAGKELDASTDGLVVLGNYGFALGAPTNEPFILVFTPSEYSDGDGENIMIMDVNGATTITISAKEVSATKLPEEFLSDSAVALVEKKHGSYSIDLIPDAYWDTLCYGNGAFVALQNNINYSKAAYSKDGTNWELVDLPNPTDIGISWTSICCGGDRFVAVGGGRYDGVAQGVAAYSIGGVKWNSVTTPVVCPTVCYGDGIFVAVGDGIMYSYDGASWQEAVIPTDLASLTDLTLTNVCYGNSKFVIIGCYDAASTNIMLHSANGINWEVAELPAAMAGAYGIGCHFGNNVFICYSGMDTTIIRYSADGITWQTGSFATFNEHYKMCYGNGIYVVPTFRTNPEYSYDGITWYEGAGVPLGTTLETVCYGNNIFVAIDSNSILWYSKDGINWAKYIPGELYLSSHGTDAAEQIAGLISPYLDTATAITIDEINEICGMSITTVDMNSVVF